MAEGIASVEQPRGPEQKQRRAQADITYPYVDLKGAISVARALHDDGGGRGDYDSLSGWMGHESSTSGTYRQKVYAARDFGLVEIKKENIRLTQAGREIVDEQTEDRARVEAFLHVPLYRAIFEEYKSGQLPQDVGLERQMQSLGVPEKQAARARQVFARSAGQAGFLEYGKHRLVKPVTDGDRPGADQEPLPQEPPSDAEGPETSSGSEKSIDLFESEATLTVSVSLDILQLSRSDRGFVMQLIDNLEDYQDQTKPKMLLPPKEVEDLPFE